VLRTTVVNNDMHMREQFLLFCVSKIYISFCVLI